MEATRFTLTVLPEGRGVVLVGMAGGSPPFKTKNMSTLEYMKNYKATQHLIGAGVKNSSYEGILFTVLYLFAQLLRANALWAAISVSNLPRRRASESRAFINLTPGYRHIWDQDRLIPFFADYQRWQKMPEDQCSFSENKNREPL